MKHLDQQKKLISLGSSTNSIINDLIKGVINPQFEEVKEMTKKDLKVGYVVEFEDKNLAMVLPSCSNDLCFSGASEYGPLTDINDDLTLSPFYTNEKIIKVYGLSNNAEAHLLSKDGRKLLWQREEIKEVTLSEIEKMYGCKVKIINNKEV